MIVLCRAAAGKARPVTSGVGEQVLLGGRDGPRLFALDDYPVEVTTALIGELKGVPGTGVAAATYAGGRGSGDRRSRTAG